VPIAYLRNKEADLAVPYPPIPECEDVLATLAQESLSELIVYPPLFKGDMTPPHWKRLGNKSRWPIEVDQSGESALVSIQNPDQYNPIPREGIQGVADPFDASSLPTGKERFPQPGYEPYFYVAHFPEHQQAMYIGGVLLFVVQDGLEFLQELFPQGSP